MIVDSFKAIRELLFLAFFPLMTCQTSQPLPPAYLPYRVLGSAHSYHVHTAPLLLSPRYTHTYARTNSTSPPFSFSLLTVAGQRQRERGVSRAASLLTPTLPQPLNAEVM